MTTHTLALLTLTSLTLAPHYYPPSPPTLGVIQRAKLRLGLIQPASDSSLTSMREQTLTLGLGLDVSTTNSKLQPPHQYSGGRNHLQNSSRQSSKQSSGLGLDESSPSIKSAVSKSSQQTYSNRENDPASAILPLASKSSSEVGHSSEGINDSANESAAVSVDQISRESSRSVDLQGGSQLMEGGPSSNRILTQSLHRNNQNTNNNTTTNNNARGANLVPSSMGSSTSTAGFVPGGGGGGGGGGGMVNHYHNHHNSNSHNSNSLSSNRYNNNNNHYPLLTNITTNNPGNPLWLEQSSDTGRTRSSSELSFVLNHRNNHAPDDSMLMYSAIGGNYMYSPPEAIFEKGNGPVRTLFLGIDLLGIRKDFLITYFLTFLHTFLLSPSYRMFVISSPMYTRNGSYSGLVGFGGIVVSFCFGSDTFHGCQ